MFMSCHDKGITQPLCFFRKGLRKPPDVICKKCCDFWGKVCFLLAFCEAQRTFVLIHTLFASIITLTPFMLCVFQHIYGPFKGKLFFDKKLQTGWD